MTEPEYSVESPGGGRPEEFWAGPKFKSVRRAFRIIDIISRRGEELTATELAGEIGTNLSSCYYLLNLLADEGYIEKIPRG
ncbi:MAG: helix-turn-helix domain-containing protein, partial [Rubrobacter sp.]|nr:helix-turn-helix domain-containing protein [Rubrobacter sp.]